jgi:RNase adapter protein RapZ
MISRKVIIVTGMSGSGKSTVAHTLEDSGFFCVDNLPVDLVPKLVDLTDLRGDEPIKLALVIDLRQRKFFPNYSTILQSLEDSGVSLDILFVEARDESLVRRFSATRRQHPLAPSGSVMDGIKKERIELAEIKSRATWIIDTSEMTVHELRDEIKKIFAKSDSGGLQIAVNSFSYGKGIPLESDLVIDVRFLPNPFFVEALKKKTGLDQEVAEWVSSKDTTRRFLEKLEDLLLFLLPLYIREGKQYLTISIGCTGGCHRSVVIAEHVGRFLAGHFEGVRVKHREIAS